MLTRLLHAQAKMPVGKKVLLLAVAWLILITWLHYLVSDDHEKRRVVTLGYMPVITNLAAPLLDYVSKNNGAIYFKALKFSSFAEMAESLRNKQIDVAFIIAPLSIVLRQQGEDIKVVYIGNRHESTLVARSDLHVKNLDDLRGKTIAVPMRYSGHNLSILELLEKKRLQGEIKVVEMNPPDMAAALSVGSLDAYYVGEPFAAQTLISGEATKLFYVEDVWKGFICNLVIVRNEMIKKEPEIIATLVRGAARSGMWAKKHPQQAARIASLYWNQPQDLVNYALTTPQNRIVYDRFVPDIHELQYMADLMQKYGLLKKNDITGLVDDRFAKMSDLQNISSLDTILQ